MPNVFLQLKELLAPSREDIATVVSSAGGSTVVARIGSGLPSNCAVCAIPVPFCQLMLSLLNSYFPLYHVSCG